MESAHLINNNGCYAGQTSDSLYFYTTDIDQLFNFLKTFSYFNAFSMLKDVYFRGGIAKGSLFYKDPHQFYGKSVVNAYLLESEISKYPIISIDCNTATDMKKQDTELYEYLIESKDYRNYMKPFSYIDCKFSIPVDDQLIKPIDEKDVLTAIEKNLDKFEFNSRNHQKYAFLVDEYKRIKNNIIKEKTDE